MIIKNKNKFKSRAKSKILVLGLILIALAILLSPVVRVEAAQMPPPNTTYNLLAPLPDTKGGTTPTVDTSGASGSLGAYLNPMITLFIGICAVLAVVMIVVGGIEVMTSEIAHTKEAGKERIWNAILGLLIALGAYALLYTINPNLLTSDLNSIQNATVTPPNTLYTCTIAGKTPESACVAAGGQWISGHGAGGSW